MRLSRRLRLAVFVLCLGLAAAVPFVTFLSAQQAPPSSAARILLLPRRIVSGERATLAVLDVNGRLTPNVRVNFSNGDRLTTDATGRAMFVAPLNPGPISATISGRSGRVYTTILNPADAATDSIQVLLGPRVASLTDRFELSGRGFCGDADANHVTIDGRPALILASSPTSLAVLPSAELAPGVATVQLSCGKRVATPFSIKMVALTLDADSSPLLPGDHRTLTVRVHGTTQKIGLEAMNLAPEIAELRAEAHGANAVRQASSGGDENSARFEVVGRQRGFFLISIRLLPSQSPPTPKAP